MKKKVSCMLSLSCARGLLPAAKPSGLWTVGVVVVGVVGKSGLSCQPLVKSLVSFSHPDLVVSVSLSGIHYCLLCFFPLRIFIRVGSVLLSKYISFWMGFFTFDQKYCQCRRSLNKVCSCSIQWWRRCIPEYKRWQFAKANTGREAIFGKEGQFRDRDMLRIPTCHRQNVGMKKGIAMSRVLWMFVPPISLFPTAPFKRKELSLTLCFPSLLCLGVLFLLVFLLPFLSRK